MRVADVLRQGVSRLTAAHIDQAGRDARDLMAHVLGVEPGRIGVMQSDPISSADSDAFDMAIAARTAGRPVSKIIGRRAFWTGIFRVTDDVLDPRPETETLVAAALDRPFTRVLDLGTGSGCILISLLSENHGATGIGVDISAAALAVAAGNAADWGCDARANFLRSDWFAGVDGLFDLIVSNPPYIAQAEMTGLSAEVREYDPRIALTDEADGLTAYRRIAADASNHLAPGGRVLVEIGWQQGDAVKDLFTDAGYAHVTVLPDLDGRDRVVAAMR